MPQSQRITLLDMLILSYFGMAAITSSMLSPALPTIETTFNLGHGQVEWVISIFLLGYMASQLAFGPLANRFGRISALRIGIGINALGLLISLLGAHFGCFTVLLIGRIVTALGAAAGSVISLTLVNEYHGHSRARHVLSYAVIPFTVGVTISVYLGGLITHYLHWKYCFIALGIYDLAILAGTCFLPETLPEDERWKGLNLPVIIRGYRAVLCCRQLVWFSMLFGCVAFITYGFSATGPIVAKEWLGQNAAQFGAWNMLTTFGMFSSSFIAVQLLKRLRGVQVTALSMIVAALCAVLLTAQWVADYHSTIAYYGCATLLFVCGGVLFPLASHYASGSYQADPANGASVSLAINLGLSGLSVIALGYLPFNSIMTYVTMLLVLGVPSGYVLWHYRHQVE